MRIKPGLQSREAAVFFGAIRLPGNIVPDIALFIYIIALHRQCVKGTGAFATPGKAGVIHCRVIPDRLHDPIKPGVPARIGCGILGNIADRSTQLKELYFTIGCRCFTHMVQHRRCDRRADIGNEAAPVINPPPPAHDFIMLALKFNKRAF